MKTGILLILVLLQPFVYAGPVCGNHLTAAESMACCESGHSNAAKTGITDNSSNSCCGSCDFSKAQLLKRHELNLAALHLATPLPSIPIVESERLADLAFYDFHRQKAYLSDPPEAFLLNETFRI